MTRRFWQFPFALRLLGLCLLLPGWAEGVRCGELSESRLVLIKVDGLPGPLLEAVLDPDGAEADRLPAPHLFRQACARARQISGRSMLLPNIHHYFVERGLRACRVDSATLTLSVPSWSLIDTGQPSLVKTNAYFNRFDGRLLNYLDQLRQSITLLTNGAGRSAALAPLDLVGIPIVTDAFAPSRVWSSLQPLTRQPPTEQLAALGRHLLSGKNRGFDWWKAARRQLARMAYGEPYPEIYDASLAELAAARLLPGSPAVDCVSLLLPAIDHQFHTDPEYGNLLARLMRLDAWIGSILQAASRGPRGPRTLAVLLSDHGSRFDPVHFNHSFPINRWLRESQFGSHNVVSPVAEDFSHAFTVPSSGVDFNRLYESAASPYGKRIPGGESGYATAFTANNGNARFSAFLRHTDLNRLHLLLLEAKRCRRSPAALRAIAAAYREVLAGCRTWLAAEVREARRAERALLELVARLGLESRGPRGEEARRLQSQERRIRAVRTALEALLQTDREEEGWLDWARRDFEISRLIPKGYLGPPNTLAGLRRYAVGWVRPPVLRWTGADEPLAFLDYPELLTSFQAASASSYGSRYPFSFFAASMAPPSLGRAARSDIVQAIWIRHAASGRELLLLEAEGGEISLENLSGEGWQEQLEAEEKKGVDSPWTLAGRAGLYGRWMTPARWSEELSNSRWGPAPAILADICRPNWRKFAERTALSRRFLPEEAELRREVIAFDFSRQVPDFHVWTADGWNVNSNSHTPGGMHGGLDRLETRLVCLFWGGSELGLRRGERLDEPYSSLDILPTVLDALGMLGPGNAPLPRSGALPDGAFPSLPGRVMPIRR